MRIAAAGDDRTFAVFGALDDAAGQRVWRLSPRQDGAACGAFLDHLIAAFPDGPIGVVLDTVGDHKGRVAKGWGMAPQDRARPRWLPAYAPEVTLMERVWGSVKATLSCHRWWAAAPALADATAGRLSRRRARFHQPAPSGIALVHNFGEAA